MTEVLLFLLLMPASDWKESFAVLLIQNTNGFQPLPSHTLHDETSTTIETCSVSAQWYKETSGGCGSDNYYCSNNSENFFMIISSKSQNKCTRNSDNS